MIHSSSVLEMMSSVDPGFEGHARGMSIVGSADIEDPAMVSCDELDKGDRDGIAKKKRAEMWQDSEMDALVSAYRQVHMKLLLAGKNNKHVFKSANEKWTEVRNLLLPMGVDRQPKEIERKWSNLLTAYKQIVEWNKKTGHPNYWELDESSKKEKTKAKELPASFRVQLYESMAEFLGDRNGRRSRSWDHSSSSVQLSGPSTSAIVPISATNSCARLPPPPPAEFGLAGDLNGLLDIPISVDKLRSQIPRQLTPLDNTSRRPAVVLLSTGSFNPPTIMHLRMFELAKDHLLSEGFNVLAGYMSPVNDAYGKQGLAPAEHRIRLCQLATLDSPFVMVDPWEARQATCQRTLMVLSRVKHAVNSCGIVNEGAVRVMLLCGADLLASFSSGAWIPKQVEEICKEYGIVCITRAGNDISKIIFDNDILYDNQVTVECNGYVQKNIFVVEEAITNNVSSSLVRKCLARGLSVKYLTPDSVINYVRMHRLYNYKTNA